MGGNYCFLISICLESKFPCRRRLLSGHQVHLIGVVPLWINHQLIAALCNCPPAAERERFQWKMHFLEINSWIQIASAQSLSWPLLAPATPTSALLCAAAACSWISNVNLNKVHSLIYLHFTFINSPVCFFSLGGGCSRVCLPPPRKSFPVRSRVADDEHEEEEWVSNLNYLLLIVAIKRGSKNLLLVSVTWTAGLFLIKSLINRPSLQWLLRGSYLRDIWWVNLIKQLWNIVTISLFNRN